MIGDTRPLLCKACRFWRRSEVSVSMQFTEGDRVSTSVIDGREIPTLYCDLINESGLIPMCHHEDCFEYWVEIKAGKKAKTKRERVAGQGQFNLDLRCTRYRRKWWKFWAPKRRAIHGEG